MTTLEEQEHLDIDELYGNNNLILDTRTESYEDIDFQDCAILADICIQYIGKKNLDGKLLKSMISMLSPKKRRSRRQHAKDDAWIESYSELAEFYEKFGDCNVSKADNANLHLFVVAKKDAFRNCNLNPVQYGTLTVDVDAVIWCAMEMYNMTSLAVKAEDQTEYLALVCLHDLLVGKQGSVVMEKRYYFQTLLFSKV